MRGFLGRRIVPVVPVVLTVVSGLAWPAEAQSRRTVLVLRLEHPGLSEGMVSRLEQAMRVRIKRVLSRYTLLPAPEIELAALQRAAGCVRNDRACLVSIGRTLDATQVVRVRLEGSRSRARLAIQRVRTRSGRASRYEAELGELDGQSPAELGWHMERAFGRNPPPLVGRVRLTAEGPSGTLEGAQIRLDERPVTIADLAFVPAGDRRIEVLQIGFEPFIWHGRVRPGRTTQVAVRWVPRSDTPAVGATTGGISEGDAEAPDRTDPSPPPVAIAEADEQPPGPSYAATWILGSATLVAASASAVLAVTVLEREKDAEDEGLDCNGVDRNADTCSAGRRQAVLTSIGWGVTAALGIATVTALIFEWPSSDEDQVQVGVGPLPGGAAASFRLTFP